MDTDNPSGQKFSKKLVQEPNLSQPNIIGDGHQPNSRGLYTHYKDSLLKVGWPPQVKQAQNDGPKTAYTREHDDGSANVNPTVALA